MFLRFTTNKKYVFDWSQTMQFNSYIFICVFLPVIVTIYFLGNRINSLIGKIILILGSAFFYAYSGWLTLIVIGLSLGFNIVFIVVIKKTQRFKKLFFAVPIIINVGLLLYFKYTNFVIENINTLFGKEMVLKELILPIGISFFTFQQIAYIVAIKKNEIEKLDIVNYLTYILFFPKIIMGPLAEPVDFINQINDDRLKKINWDNIAYGVKIFSFGLFKKLLLADTFAKAVSWGYSNMGTATSIDWLLVMLFYTLEIYFDFSGYSDMAVGASMMMNITLPINFDSPYKAITIRDFWKRWHISLTKFFTKYVYIPLGGSKKGIILTYINTMIIFIVSGIWHGANWTFILWGILHGAFSLLDRIIEKTGKKIFEPFRWLLTFGVINILWLLFRSDSIIQWKGILKTILCMSNTTISDNLINVFTIREASLIGNIVPCIANLSQWIRGFWMFGFIIFSLAVCFIPNNNYKRLQKNSILTMFFAAAAFIWSFICLSSESVFVYFNF